MQVMTKKKTSLNIDEQLWTKWVIYVVTKTGTTRKVSEETQKALEEYMSNHPIDKPVGSVKNVIFENKTKEEKQ